MPDNSDTEQDLPRHRIVPSWVFSAWLLIAGAGGISWLWGRTPKALEDVRRLVLNLAVLGTLLLVGYTVWQAVDEDMMIVDAFAVPKAVEEQGYSGADVAQRVIDRVEFIHSTARSRVERQQIGHESQFASLSSLQLPQSGLTIQTVVSVLRKVFRPPDDRIGGQITTRQEADGMAGRTYAMALRFDIDRNTADRLGRPTDSRHFVKSLEAASLEDLIERAAQAIVEMTAPATLASYLYQEREWSRLDKLLDQLVESSKDKIKIRAWTLRGIRYIDQCRFDEGLSYFERAIRANPKGKFVTIKYGEALVRAGRPDDAITIFEQAEKVPSKSNVLLYGSWAKALALASSGGLSAAEAKLRQADSEADKAGGRDSRIHRIWGDILRNHQQYDRASMEYRIAVALDPNDPAAYEKWGLLLLEQGDIVGAIEKLRAAIATNVHLPEARYHLGWALLRQGDVPGALKAFRDAASEAGPDQAKAWSDIADKLAREPAAAMLEVVKAEAPAGCPSSGRHRPPSQAHAEAHKQGRS